MSSKARKSKRLESKFQKKLGELLFLFFNTLEKTAPEEKEEASVKIFENLDNRWKRIIGMNKNLKLNPGAFREAIDRWTKELKAKGTPAKKKRGRPKKAVSEQN